MTIDDLVGAAYLPTDGQANPSDITQSLARGARMAGVQHLRGYAGHPDPRRRGPHQGRRNPVRHASNAKRSCCCAGQWTRTLAATVGVNVPLVSVEHQYMVTERIEGVTPNLPTLRDPDRLTYWKEEVGGLVWGGYEPNPKPWARAGHPRGLPLRTADLGLGALRAVHGKRDCPRSGAGDGGHQATDQRPGKLHARRQLHPGRGTGTAELLSSARASTPSASPRAAGRAWRWPNGWPKARRPMIFGPSISAASGACTARPTGSAPARWRPTASTTPSPGRPKNITPPGPPAARRSTRISRRRAPASARSWAGSVRTGSPTSRQGKSRSIVYSYQRPGWWNAVRREHLAAREAAVLIDQTSFAKFALKGPDAARALNQIAAGNVDRAVGSLTYTQMLNARGGIEADVTVVRTAQDEFYIVTGTGFATHDFDWIARRIPPDANCQLVDVTSGSSVLSLMGPKARQILARVSSDDLSNAAFPFATARPDQCRPLPGSCAARDLCGRAWVGIAHAHRRGRDGLRGADGCGPRSRAGERRLPRDRNAAAGKRLPRLGQSTSAPTTRRSRRAWPGPAR